MSQFKTTTRNETLAMGGRLAERLMPGDVLLLSGDLGAGKSELARGIARGLGIAGPVPSPTFSFLIIYDTGRVSLHHFDWYRAQDEEEIMAAGLEEYIQGDWITLIEWHERAPGLCPKKHLLVQVDQAGEETRLITFVPMGGFRDLGLMEDIL
ncbi:MAG: tRNA (adenosine(37)-N6)-threonylcarbamoyltransferase complex ATPase subunit type 1 TsaE [Eubacteriales bacterium]|nr:tRNA (adenosine(37)-N6)-threonylcarbamoyltransferase complex ATPase subunit type 1 TsaE [Eubacteriales bacterium]